MKEVDAIEKVFNKIRGRKPKKMLKESLKHDTHYNNLTKDMTKDKDD